MRTKTNDTGYNAAEHNDLCVGIDLGTTNSVLATINEKLNGDIVSKVVEIPRAVDMYNAMSGEAKLTKMKKPKSPRCPPVSITGRRMTTNRWWGILRKSSIPCAPIWWRGPSRARWEAL